MINIIELRTELNMLQVKISLQGFYQTPDKVSVIQKYNLLTLIVTLYNSIEKDLIDHDGMMQLDPIAFEVEMNELLQNISIKEQQLKHLLNPQDTIDDNKNVIVEIRAGTGGDEGALFAYDLYRMYELYAKSNNWNIIITDSNAFTTQGNLNAVKRIILEINGKQVFKKMKFESGTHRVIRNPITDSSDRTHTSSATVAVFPIIEEIEFELNESDLNIETYKGSGAGGQHRNTTDSAVRITHIPSGVVVKCESERSQSQNKETAMKELRTRLYNKVMLEQLQEKSLLRKLLVGRGDWTNRIRTYNYKKNEFFDHRINYSTTKIYEILNGQLDLLVNKLEMEYKKI